MTRESAYKRINRELQHRSQKLRRTRGQKRREQLGEYYVVETRDRPAGPLQYVGASAVMRMRVNYILKHHVDLETLAHEMGLMAPWQKLTMPDDRPAEVPNPVALSA